MNKNPIKQGTQVLVSGAVDIEATVSDDGRIVEVYLEADPLEGTVNEHLSDEAVEMILAAAARKGGKDEQF